MKRRLFWSHLATFWCGVLLVCGVSLTTPHRVSSGVYGDVNGDGVVDIDDVNEVINVMLGKPHGGGGTILVSDERLSFTGEVNGVFTQTITLSGDNLRGAVNVVVQDDSGAFSVTPSHIDLEAAMQGAELKVTYAPQATGTHTARLLLSSEDAPSVTVTLSGTAYESQPDGRNWALVKLAVATLRSEARHSSELTTQAVMGTPMKVLDDQGDWLRVQLPDDYIAWVPESSLLFRSEAQLQQWRQLQRYIVTVDHTKLLADTCTGAVVSDLVLSNILEYKGVASNQWVRLATPDGREGWANAAEVADLDQWKRQSWDIDLIERTALNMMGCGYLWGGTSTMVTDCSGLMKVCYLANGIILQRDASQQALTGQKIADWHQCETGDLLFFGNKKTGRVTHVGMYLRDGKYIHCSGRVKINSLDTSAPDYLYSPLSISRIRGQVAVKRPKSAEAGS